MINVIFQNFITKGIIVVYLDDILIFIQMLKEHYWVVVTIDTSCLTDGLFMNKQMLGFLLYDFIIGCDMCSPCIWSVSALCSSWGFIMFSLLFPHFLHMYYIWSLDIYSYRYYPVSLHFTNWLYLSFLLKFLPELQPEPSLRSWKF